MSAHSACSRSCCVSCASAVVTVVWRDASERNQVARFFFCLAFGLHVHKPASTSGNMSEKEKVAHGENKSNPYKIVVFGEFCSLLSNRSYRFLTFLLHNAGAGGVGKSSVTLRFTNGIFSPVSDPCDLCHWRIVLNDQMVRLCVTGVPADHRRLLQMCRPR